MTINHQADLFYAIYSPSRKAWRDENGTFGPFFGAEKFRTPEKIIAL